MRFIDVICWRFCFFKVFLIWVNVQVHFGGAKALAGGIDLQVFSYQTLTAFKRLSALVAE